MSLAHPSPKYGVIPPEVEQLPDGRLAYTRFMQIGVTGQITADLISQLALGAADPIPLFPDATKGPRLTNRTIEHNPDGNTYVKLRFEQLKATGETQTGGLTERVLDDGRVGFELTYLQWSSDTFTPGTPGTDVAPNDANAYLLKVDAPDDGTLRRITRTYVYAGTLSTDTQTKQGGKLMIKVITSAKTVPSTPSGYTLIGQPVQSPSGLPIYSYTYAKGAGRVSTKTGERFKGKLTYTTIVYLGTDDGVTPSGTLNATETEQRDGYTITTDTYYSVTSDGYVTNDAQETRNGGALVMHHSVRIGSAPATPSAAIAGTVTLISANTRQEEGFTIYDYTWAEGVGEISREIDYLQSSDQGTTGITRTTIRYLVAPAASVQPTALAGSVEIGRTVSESDGYRIWTTTWAKGTGTVIQDVQWSNGGKLVLYRTVKLGSAPSAPTPTISGTVTALATDVRQEAGHVVYDYRWAEGLGVVAEQKITRNDGLMEWHQTIFSADTLPITASTFDTAWKPTANAVLLRLSSRLAEGHAITDAAWMVAADGSTAPTGASVATEIYVPFHYPGRAKYFSQSVTVGGTATTCHDVFLSPPVTSLVLATKTISYQTGATIGALANTLWNPTDYCTLIAKFGAWGPAPRSIVKALEGYTAVNAGSSGTAGVSGLDTSVLGERVYGGAAGTTQWSISLSGGPTSPNGSTTYTLHAEVEPEPVFIKYDGTKYYRKIIVTATPAAQSALPV